MKQTDPQFKLRLPHALKEKLEAAAAEKERTLTAEIVARLESSFELAKENEYIAGIAVHFTQVTDTLVDRIKDLEKLVAEKDATIKKAKIKIAS